MLNRPYDPQDLGREQRARRDEARRIGRRRKGRDDAALARSVEAERRRDVALGGIALDRSGC